jgi:hypothetical protein
MQWPFIGCFIVASFVLLGTTLILGVVCRLNFGKGLKQYRKFYQLVLVDTTNSFLFSSRRINACILRLCTGVVLTR